MLYFDALRGMDSTGVFGVDKHANVQIHKEASQAGTFLKAKEISTFKGELIRRGVFAVGHNRAATRGKINDVNSHPFWIEDKIVLVQNGTYKGDHSHHKDTEVDTEAVAHVIAETPDVAEALQKINAAYALVWFNTETKTLYMIRNSERPLYLAWADQTLLWCSDPGFLFLAAGRNNLKLTSPPTMQPFPVPRTALPLNVSYRGGDQIQGFLLSSQKPHPQTVQECYNDESYFYLRIKGAIVTPTKRITYGNVFFIHCQAIGTCLTALLVRCPTRLTEMLCHFRVKLNMLISASA